MGTKKRYTGALFGVLVGAMVLTGCSGDEVVTETTAQTAVNDRVAVMNQGLEQWRRAEAAQARLAAQARVELLRAQARVAGEALRAGAETGFGVNEADIERLRAAARVAGDTLRMKIVDGAEGRTR